MLMVKKFMMGNQVYVWLNNEYLPTHPEYSWIKEASSKSVKHSIECDVSLYKIFQASKCCS